MFNRSKKIESSPDEQKEREKKMQMVPIEDGPNKEVEMKLKSGARRATISEEHGQRTKPLEGG